MKEKNALSTTMILVQKKGNMAIIKNNDSKLHNDA